MLEELNSKFNLGFIASVECQKVMCVKKVGETIQWVCRARGSQQGLRVLGHDSVEYFSHQKQVSNCRQIRTYCYQRFNHFDDFFIEWALLQLCNLLPPPSHLLQHLRSQSESIADNEAPKSFATVHGESTFPQRLEESGFNFEARRVDEFVLEGFRLVRRPTTT